MQQVHNKTLLESPFKPTQSKDWAIALRAIFELILLNQSKLAQATTLALANAYRDSDEFLDQQILTCTKQLWKIARYVDLINEHHQNERYHEAVDIIQPTLELGHQLLESDYFQLNHYQFLIHYLYPNKQD